MGRFEMQSISFLTAFCLGVCGLVLAGFPTTVRAQDPHEHGKHEHGKHEHGKHAHPGDDQMNAPGFHRDFNDAERWTKRFDAPERPEWQKPEEVTEILGLQPGMTVADIGAGTGFFLGHLSAAVGDGGRVLGLDVADDMVAHMERRAEEAGWANVEARVVPFDDPELEAASVDRVLIVNTWHHIDARKNYTEKLRRALRPGGAVVVVDYTLESADGPPKNHRLSAERVVAELEAGGLEAKIVEESLPRQYVVVGRLP